MCKDFCGTVTEDSVVANTLLFMEILDEFVVGLLWDRDRRLSCGQYTVIHGDIGRICGRSARRGLLCKDFCGTVTEDSVVANTLLFMEILDEFVVGRQEGVYYVWAGNI